MGHGSKAGAACPALGHHHTRPALRASRGNEEEGFGKRSPFVSEKLEGKEKQGKTERRKRRRQRGDKGPSSESTHPQPPGTRVRGAGPSFHTLNCGQICDRQRMSPHKPEAEARPRRMPRACLAQAHLEPRGPTPGAPRPHPGAPRPHLEPPDTTLSTQTLPLEPPDPTWSLQIPLLEPLDPPRAPRPTPGAPRYHPRSLQIPPGVPRHHHWSP